MSSRRFVLLLVAAVIVISAALLLATRRESSPETRGVLLLPALAADLNAVTEVSLTKGGSNPAATIQKSAGGWTLKERGGYPADVSKLRTLLTALGDAKIVEKKTSDPARYAVIGVEDPSQPGATGTEITVSLPGGRHAVIVGKSVGEGNFVRLAGENQSYSVEPGIPVESEPKFWIDSRLIDVPAASIQSIAFRPATGAPYAIRRPTADGPFSLEGVPDGRKPLEADALKPAATTLTALTAEDVAPADGIDFGQPFVVTVTRSDGDVITLTGVTVDTKHWVQITSTKDSALTDKARGRAFEVAGYRYDAIFKPLEQLLSPKPSPAPKGAPASKASAPRAAHVPGKT